MSSSTDPITFEYLIQRGEIRYQKIEAIDDVTVSTKYSLSNPISKVHPYINYTMTTNPALILEKGLYVNDTIFLSINWFIFLAIVVVMVVCLITTLVVRARYFHFSPRI